MGEDARTRTGASGSRARAVEAIESPGFLGGSGAVFRVVACLVSGGGGLAMSDDTGRRVKGSE